MVRKLALIMILSLIIVTGIWAYISTGNSQWATILTDKPPMPKVTYDDKSIEVYRGSYSWKTTTGGVIADALAPYDIIKGKDAVFAKPGDSLNFSFPYTPRKAEVRIWSGNEVLHASPSSGIITVPGFEGTYAIEIYAEWKEGHGIYTIKLEVKDKQDSRQSKPKPDIYKPSVKLPLTSMSLEAIAGELFSKYLEHYMTAETPEMERLKAYKIEKIILNERKEGYYTAEIEFSVQGAINNTVWTAGNGEMTEDNWVRNKLVFARISMREDVYTLESFGTGP